MAKKRSPAIYLVALLLFAGSIGYLVWSGLSSDKVYFLNVSEALALPYEQSQQCRLFGYVLADNLQHFEDGLTVRFDLEDTERPGVLIPVTYRGAVPDTFGPGAEVIVEGVMLDGEFTANTLMTKCASKYENLPDGAPKDAMHPDGIPM